MSAIFFYGLFMDRSLLVEKGLDPVVVGPAVLENYRIHIGERATLLPAPTHRAFGMVMDLREAQAQHLYADPSVAAYRRERVAVRLLGTGETMGADCYNLPGQLALAGVNAPYADRLARLAEELGFASAYVREIAAFGKG